MDPIVAILAGGRSRRMGRPKPALELGGRPLISYPLAAARAAGLEPWIVAKRGSELPPAECRLLFEPDEPRHPLLGVVTALRDARPAPVLALAADMPFVTGELLSRLAACDSTAAVEAEGRLQPLLARYEAAVLESLERALAADAAATAALEALEPEAIEAPPLCCFNVNSPADLERAEQLLAG
ncbi:MAG TPA: molybdenum cofactor guanylyltransferase [Solirubrobacterales bacterium]|nr:molybdenum cofactor guanylyltransferase [Solirubrobacterales bacterium]